MQHIKEALAGKHVLVVEDEFLIALDAEIALSNLGAVVVGPAARLSEAMTLVETQEIDAAVLDVNLNGETSLPIAEVLNKKGIPFVFVSGALAADLPIRFREHLIAKPAAIETIADGLFGASRQLKTP